MSLPKGWIRLPLENVVDILDSKRIPVNNKERANRIAGKDEEELYPYYGATGKTGYIDDYIFDEELVLLGEDGVPFFDSKKHKAYIISGKSWVNNHAHVLRAKKILTSNSFLAYFLNQFDYHGYVNGATRLKLNQTNMKKIPFLLAPLNEQKRISKKLDELLATVERVKTRLDNAPTLIKRFRQSVLAAATSGRLTEEWRRENGVSDEWEYLTVGDVSEVATGKTPLKSNASYYENGNIPWLTSSVTGKDFVTEANGYVTQKAIDECSLKIFEPGTLLVAMYGEGKTRGQVTELTFPASINQACAAIIVDNEKIDKAYLKLKLQENYAEIRMLAEGGNQPNLNLSKVRSISVPTPSKEEQKEIVSQVESLFAVADALEEKIEAAKKRIDKLTQSILAKAFRGELLPQDPNDEPAEKLLERIRAEQEAVKPKRKAKKREEK